MAEKVDSVGIDILDSRHNGNRHYGTVDIMGIDILGVDILGIDILAQPRRNTCHISKTGTLPCFSFFSHYTSSIKVTVS